MKRAGRWRWGLWVAVWVGLAGCDWEVDRSNPYDPASEAPATVAVSGHLVSPDGNAEVFTDGPDVVLTATGAAVEPLAATVDPAGRFRFPEVPPGGYTLSYVSPALRPLSVVLTVSAPRQAADQTLDLGALRLQAEAEDSDRLVRVSGLAQRNRADDGQHAGIDVWAPGTGQRATTDEAGRYELLMPRDSTRAYPLVAQAEGYTSAQVEVTPGVTAPVPDLLLEPIAPVLSVSVLLPAGVQGPAVVRYHPGSPRCLADDAVQRALAFNAATQRYETDDLPPTDEGGLHVVNPAVQPLCVPVALQPGRRVEIDGLRPTPLDTVRITGQVQTGGDATPARGVLVSLDGAVAVTGEDGGFVLDVPTSDEERAIQLSGAGYAATSHRLPATTGQAHYAYPQPLPIQYIPAQLTFRVRFDRFGHDALALVAASVVREADGSLVQPDRDGARFEADDLQPFQAYRLTVTRPGYAARSETFEPRPGERVNLGDLVLEHLSQVRPDYLTPRVLTAEGEPIAGARYEVRLAEGARSVLVESGATDAEGRLVVPVAPGEAYDLRVTAAGYQPFEGRVTAPPAGEAGVVLQPTGVRRADLVLPIEPLNGEIVVSVDFGFDWLPQGDTALVSVRPAGGEPERRPVSAAQGVERFRGLERGLYTVRVERPGFLAVEQDVLLALDNREAAVQANLLLVDLATARPGFGPGDRLPGADLQPRPDRLRINVVGANLAGLRLEGDFSGLDLSRTELSGATLADAVFTATSLENASLFQVRAERADFDRARLGGANLSSGVFSDASFVGAQLTEVDATRANFDRARFVDPLAPPPATPCAERAGGDPSRANLRGIRLTDSDLAGAEMAGVDLRRADLGFARLDGTALSQACLAEADLTLSRLRGTLLSRADLTEASLVNAVLTQTDLRGANLTRAVLFGVSMDRADLGCVASLGEWPGEVFCDCPSLPRGEAVCPERARDPLPWDQCRTNLTGANLGGAVVAGTNLTGADLYSARLVGVDLSAVCAEGEGGAVDCDQRSRFTQADFTLAQLPGMLVGAVDLRGTCFRGADLTSAEFSRQTRFTAADFRGATLEGARMDEADLRTARFDGAEMARAQLRSVRAQGVRFDHTDLRSAELEDANLTGARFREAELHRVRMSPLVATGADFEGATLNGVQLTFDPAFQDVRLTGAALQGASLNGVMQRVDLRGADLSRTTTRAPLVVNDVSFEGATLDDARWTVDRVRGADFSDVTWTGGHLLGTDGSYGGGLRPNPEEAPEGPERCANGDRHVPRTDTPFVVSSFDRSTLTDLDLSGLDFVGTTFRSTALRDLRFSGSDFDGSVFDEARGLSLDFANARFGLGSFRAARLEGADLSFTGFDGTDLLDLELPGVGLNSTMMHRVRIKASDGQPLDWTEARIGEGLCLSASTVTDLDLSAAEERPTRGGIGFNYSTVGAIDLTGHSGLVANSSSSIYEPDGIVWDHPAWIEGLEPDNARRVFSDPDIEVSLCQMARDACGPDGAGNPCPVIDFACEEYDENNTECDMEWCGVARDLMCDPDGELASLEARVNLPIVGEQVLELPLSALLDPCAFLVERNCINSFGSCQLYAGARVTSDLSGDTVLGPVFKQANLSGADLSGRSGLQVSDVNFDGARLVGSQMLSGRPPIIPIRVQLSFRDADLTNFDWGALADNAHIDLVGATVSEMRGTFYGSDVRLDQGSAASRPFGARIWMRGLDLSESPPIRTSFSQSDLRGVRIVDVELIADGLVSESNLDGVDWSGSTVQAGPDSLVVRDSALREGRFFGTNLTRVRFERAALHGSRFDSQPDRQTRLVDAAFTSSSMLYGSFIGADLTGATFEDFWLGNKDYTGATFGPANLSGHDFSDATLDQVDLDGATLTDTTWFRVSAVNVRLNGVDLAGAWIAGTLAGAQLGPHEGQPANLTGAHLVNVDLRGANLRLANLSGADLWGAQLQGANLTDTVVDDATILVGAQVCADAPAEFFTRGAVLAEEGCE